MARLPHPTSPAGRLLELAESALGVAVRPTGQVRALEEQAVEYGAQSRMLDLLGWSVLDHFSGREQEVKWESRKVMARKARVAWINDPMVGGAVALMNDFVLGRGIPKPRCRDELVQEKVDEAWDDPDNRRILTDFLAQIALNTDLSLQSNVLFLLFDEGDDGRVKISTLNYDSVEDAVTDPENRHRVLWYVARQRKAKWDFENDRWEIDTQGDIRAEKWYYEHWHNVKDAEDEDRAEPLDKPKEDRVGKGRVHHVALNRTSEMVFGVPEWQRVLRWATAYNDFMKSRVDMVKAAAAFVLKNKVTGSPAQVARLAAKVVSSQRPLAGGQFPIDVDATDYGMAPRRPGAVLTENEASQWESFKIDSGAANAQLDAANLRSQFSASTRWPQHYLGAGDGPGLATATAMELPVLKMVETRIEIIEGIYRWFIDRVIERAVDAGTIPEEVEPEATEEPGAAPAPLGLAAALREASENGERMVGMWRVPPLRGRKRVLLATRNLGRDEHVTYRVVYEAHEDKTADEANTQRDLGYDFKLTSPLRRMMSDLVGSVANVARTFDPNNTNLELSRTLLYVALSDGLEMENASDLVDEIFPEGYVDPMLAQAQAQAEGEQPGSPNGQPNFFGPDFARFMGAEGEMHGPENPYGAPMQSTPPERVRTQQAVVRELPDDVADEVTTEEKRTDSLWAEVVSVVQDELADLATTNGKAAENGR